MGFLDEARDAVEGGVCRGCGCTDEEACEGGCIWVEPDLCSRCAITDGDDPNDGDDPDE